MTSLARHLEQSALALVRRWWRPIVCMSMGGSLFVNGCVLPLLTKTYPDLTGLAALAVSLAPFAWLRSSEKANGTA